MVKVGGSDGLMHKNRPNIDTGPNTSEMPMR
jgi:hypothetical protein